MVPNGFEACKRHRDVQYGMQTDTHRFGLNLRRSKAYVRRFAGAVQRRVSEQLEKRSLITMNLTAFCTFLKLVPEDHHNTSTHHRNPHHPPEPHVIIFRM